MCRVYVSWIIVSCAPAQKCVVLRMCRIQICRVLSADYSFTVLLCTHSDTGCFISFDPLFIFFLSLRYSIVERYWLYIFEEQHLSYQSKNNCIEFAWTIRDNDIDKNFEKILLYAFFTPSVKRITFPVFCEYLS